jgi:hypothetical protein
MNTTPTQYPTVDELRPFLGDDWTVCRKTAANLARYGRCLTPKEFRLAQERALAAREEKQHGR